MWLLYVFLCFNGHADENTLRIAIEMDNVISVRRQIESGEFTIDSKISAASYDQIPLIALAARFSSEKVTDYLIAAGADLNARNEVDETALMLAVFFSVNGVDVADRVARAIVDGGADITTPLPGYGPIAYAAYSDRLRIVTYLLSKGASVDENIKDGISTANTGLMMAAFEGHLEMLRLLLDHGANVHIVNSRGDSAYTFAKKYRHTHLFSSLDCAQNLKPEEKFREKCH